MNTKAVSLLSGGLDSALATKLIKDQGWKWWRSISRPLFPTLPMVLKKDERFRR